MSSRIWKPIPCYEGYYEVSSVGDVRRIASGRSTFPGRRLKPWLDSRGYLRVRLSRPGRHEGIEIHRIVASAFLGRLPDGYHVNHINGRKEDCGVENLEYVTPADNLRHAQSIGLMPDKVGERNGQAKLSEEDAIRIKSLRGKMTQQAIADRYGVTQSHVSKVQRGVLWSHLEVNGDGD